MAFLADNDVAIELRARTDVIILSSAIDADAIAAVTNVAVLVVFVVVFVAVVDVSGTTRRFG